MTDIEKRKFERYPIQLPASGKSQSTYNSIEHFDFVTNNISQGGLFFNTDLQLKQNSELILEVIIPDYGTHEAMTHRELIETKGRVVRVEKNGVGIQFFTKLNNLDNKLNDIDSYLKINDISEKEWLGKIHRISSIYFNIKNQNTIKKTVH